MELRPYLPDDEQPIVALWNQCLTQDRITAGTFRERTLLDPNFDPRGSLLATDDGHIAGFVSGLRRAVAWWDYAPMPDRGWITTLFIDPAYRRRGIGTQLLRAAMDHMQSQRVIEVRFAHFSPHYYFPGVDEAAYPGALAFFQHGGFGVEEKVVAMGRQLYNLEEPIEVAENEQQLAQHGIRCCYFEPRYLLPALAFFEEAFPTWAYFFRKKVAVELWPEDEMVLVLDRERVIGYCQQVEGEHIGPFGIRPEYRGQGIGTIMLYRLLRRMHEKGLRYAWFGMTEHAESYYARAGFVRTRTHLKLYRRL